MGKQLKILLVALENYGTPRLPQELQAAGFQVGLACRASAFLAKTRFVDERFLLSPRNHGPALLAVLRNVIGAWRPDWVMPMDDRAAIFLTVMCRWSLAEGQDAALAKLLTRSLGNPEALPAAADKWLAAEAAAAVGVCVPPTGPAPSAAAILDFGAQHGFPVVLRRRFNFGGKDVHVCRDQAEVKKAFAKLQKEFSLRGRFTVWREKIRQRQLGNRWLPVSREVVASKFIAGRPAMLQACAVDGRLLGSLEAVALKTFPHAISPASVVRFIRHDGMRRTTETLLARWRLSGLIGFDFVLDDEDCAWFVECNPRPIPIVHLGARVGVDLCRRFRAELAGEPPSVEKIPGEEIVVAHFPKELRRDPQSEWLQRALHDVPTDDPELMAALLAESTPRNQG